ncbi:hypothetical protein, partial [Acinetobacter baumannii]|uniref:hypothetical protein n=1 Tax=Acinetobacter baumannii TaxID=470 RepID=UPI00289FA93D
AWSVRHKHASQCKGASNRRHLDAPATSFVAGAVKLPAQLFLALLRCLPLSPIRHVVPYLAPTASGG